MPHHLLIAHGSPDPRHARRCARWPVSVDDRGLPVRGGVPRARPPPAYRWLARRHCSGAPSSPSGCCSHPATTRTVDVPGLLVSAPAGVVVDDRGPLGTGPWLFRTLDWLVADVGAASRLTGRPGHRRVHPRRTPAPRSPTSRRSGSRRDRVRSSWQRQRARVVSGGRSRGAGFGDRRPRRTHRAARRGAVHDRAGRARRPGAAGGRAPGAAHHRHAAVTPSSTPSSSALCGLRLGARVGTSAHAVLRAARPSERSGARAPGSTSCGSHRAASRG